MLQVTRTSTKASPDRVWSVLGDVEHWGEFLPTFDSVRHIDGPTPTAVGSRFEVRQPGLVAANYEVSVWDPRRSFTWVGHAPGARTTAIHEVVETDHGTELTLGIVWSGPLAWAIRLLLSAKARRMMQSEAEHILARAEQL